MPRQSTDRRGIFHSGVELTVTGPRCEGGRGRLGSLYRTAMHRIIFALLALFAGLAAQVAPAQAQLDAGTEIGAAISARAGARPVAAATAAVFRPHHPAKRVQSAALQARPQLRIAAARAVLIGIDRARE